MVRGLVDRGDPRGSAPFRSGTGGGRGDGRVRRGGDGVTVKCRGLPYTTTELAVAEFFQDYDVSRVKEIAQVHVVLHYHAIYSLTNQTKVWIVRLPMPWTLSIALRPDLRDVLLLAIVTPLPFWVLYRWEHVQSHEQTCNLSGIHIVFLHTNNLSRK